MLVNFLTRWKGQPNLDRARRQHSFVRIRQCLEPAREGTEMDRAGVLSTGSGWRALAERLRVSARHD